MTCSMVLIPCVLLAVFPPGFLFPQMAARMSAKGRRTTTDESRSQTDKQVGKSGGSHGKDADESQDQDQDIEQAADVGDAKM